MAVNWKQIMIMLLKGVSQNRVASGARCSKRDVSRAARVVRGHGVSLDALMGMTDRQVRERWCQSRFNKASNIKYSAAFRRK